MTEASTLTLLQRFEAEWQPFWRRVEALDGEGLRSVPAGSTWPIAMILAHCARWEDWNHATISARVQDGSVPSMKGLEQWNDEWAAEDRDVPPEDARRWLSEAHERLRALLNNLRPDQWDELVTRCVEACTFHHYGEHIGSLPA